MISKIDYCNVLLANATTDCTNNSISFVYALTKKSRVTQYLKSAHILPVYHRIKYKACTFVYRIINGLAPNYLNDLVVLRPMSRINLRSNNDDLQIVHTPYVNSLQHALIRNWNLLPNQLRA